MRFLEILLPAHFLTMSCHFERAARIECNLITEIIGRESKNLPGTGDWLIGYSCAKHPNIPITQFSNSRINDLRTSSPSIYINPLFRPIASGILLSSPRVPWDIAHLRLLGFRQYHNGG